jgi:hypothetical protein
MNFRSKFRVELVKLTQRILGGEFGEFDVLWSELGHGNFISGADGTPWGSLLLVAIMREILLSKENTFSVCRHLISRTTGIYLAVFGVSSIMFPFCSDATPLMHFIFVGLLFAIPCAQNPGGTARESRP